jgi:hypothetical protein
MEWTLENMVIILAVYIAGWVTRALVIHKELDAEDIFDDGWHECDVYWWNWLRNQKYDVADYFDDGEHQTVLEPSQAAISLVS